ncbi:MAG: hypothetical protein WBM46_00180 [Polyangiales bacterium]
MREIGKYLVVVASLLGLLVFLSVFVATFTSRPVLEDAMSGFVRSRVQQEVRDRLGSATGADAGALSEWFETHAEATAGFLENDLDAFVDYVVDSLCDVDCEESRKADITDWVRGASEAFAKRRIEEFGAISTQLKRFVRGKYLDLVRALISEIRVFSGLNAALFAYILALLLSRWREPRVVFLPASLLLIATVACSALYVFNQNWFFSIFLERYWGYWYLAYVAIVFGLLLDIAINRARITSAILDTIGAALSPVS